MFDAPTSTLYNSLNSILERPKEFLADVCFTFSSIEIWAHRALILARAPKEFIQQYLPELLLTYKQSDLPLRIDISHIIPLDLFSPLLRFWYTASFYKILSPQSSISDLSSITTPNNSSPVISTKEIITQNSHISETTISHDIQYEIEQLGIQLGTALLPLHSDSVPDFSQLINDLKVMRYENLAADVTIELVTSINNNDIPIIVSTPDDSEPAPVITSTITSFRAHRFILAAQSTYFYSLFCAHFQESSSDIVHLTSDLFNKAIIDLMLNFFYTDKIIVEPLKGESLEPKQHKIQHRKHTLRVIQKAFYAADYLGHSETFGQAILHEMETLCHQFKCICSDCAILLPSMLAWSDKHKHIVPHLRRTLILLYADPIQSLTSLWSQNPYSMLISSIVSNPFILGENTLQSVLKQEPLFRERVPETIIHEIEERTFYNVTKHNAIQALHSMHLCLSQIRSVDPMQSWSRPALDLLNPILQYMVNMVSQFFDFYCVEYPILLSCVDGIGGGFSVDFLDFLLRQVLNDGINENNAGVIYQGIVRDLVGRQEVVKNMMIDDVLIKARMRCANYIAKKWARIKADGGFKQVDKSIMRQLSEDTGIPYRSLTKPFDSDFSNIFSFKPKKTKKAINTDDKNATLKEVYTRRLSISQLMTRSSSITENRRIQTRPRALSSESALLSSFRQYHNQQDDSEQLVRKENQPLITLLTYETMDRRKQLEEKDSIRTLNESNISKLQYSDDSSKSLFNELDDHNRPVLRTSSSFTSLSDQLLLPVDTEKKQERPSRLKFELPVTPVRSKPSSRSKSPMVNPNTRLTVQQNPHSKNQKHRRGSKSRKSRWTIGSDVSDEEDGNAMAQIGDKIELLRRPLPTLGTIRYIGPVQFAEGQYFGIELESRLGKNDGSVEGIRYFQTDPQRGLFVKPDDFILHARST